MVVGWSYQPRYPGCFHHQYTRHRVIRNLPKVTCLVETALVASLEMMVSAPRLQRYRRASASDLETVTNYLWNIQLAESLLPCIAFLEVCLRNATHNAVTAREGTDYWFQRVLQPKRWETVEKIIAELAGVSTNPPIVLPAELPPAGKVVAKLTFGFWPHLFSRHYRKLWWTPQSQLIATVFARHPNVTASTRSDVHLRLLYVNELRNRAMHHEAIFQGVSIPNHSVKAIDALHDEIIEMVGWLEPDAARLLNCLNRFPVVFAPSSSTGKLGIEAALREEFKIP